MGRSPRDHTFAAASSRIAGEHSRLRPVQDQTLEAEETREQDLT